MRISKLNFAVIVAGLLVLGSCKKDNTKPEVIQYQQPLITNYNNVVDIPEGLNTLAQGGDADAYTAIGYMLIANTYAAYSSEFILPQDVQEQSGDNNSVIYSWSYNGYSTWMTYKKESDKYVWTWEWQTPSTGRFTYMKAEQGLDGMSGSWTNYNPDNTGQVLWSYSWTKDASDNLTITLKSFDNGVLQDAFVTLSNADGSGNFVYNSGEVKQAEVNWNADGSGDYWVLNSDGPASNSWPAG